VATSQRTTKSSSTSRPSRGQGRELRRRPVGSAITLSRGTRREVNIADEMPRVASQQVEQILHKPVRSSRPRRRHPGSTIERTHGCPRWIGTVSSPRRATRMLLPSISTAVRLKPSVPELRPKGSRAHARVRRRFRGPIGSLSRASVMRRPKRRRGALSTTRTWPVDGLPR